MRPTPHDYQVRAIDNARAAYRDGAHSAVIVAPTGAGKTVIACEVIHAAVARGSRVVFLAHRRELIDQASRRLAMYGVWHGIIQSGMPERRAAGVQVASIQTLIRRDLPPADLVILDECHHAASASNRQLLDAYPNARLLGLTATPWRLDGSGLGDIFEQLIQVCQPRDLIERTPPVLVESRSFAPVTPNLEGVRSSMGDYKMDDLETAMATLPNVEEIIKNWCLHAPGRPTVVFAVGIRHSLMIRDAFRAIGVKAEHLDGKTPMAERARVLAAMVRGEIQVLSNCQLFAEGWDFPALSCAILARPTKSLSLYLQQVGRVLRASPGKTDAILLDHAGNHGIHDHPTIDRHWDLAGRKKGPKGEAPIKTCPKCFAVVPSALMVCPECGHEWIQEERETEEADRNVELQEVTYRGRNATLPPLERHDRWLAPYLVLGREHTNEEKQALYDVLAERCIQRGHKTGAIWHKFQLVVGKGPSNQVRAASPYAEQIANRKAHERAEREMGGQTA